MNHAIMFTRVFLSYAFLTFFQQLTLGDLVPGEMIVTEQSTGRVLQVNLDGALTVITQGDNLFNPTDATVTANGELFVVESSKNGGSIVHVDPVTGAQTVVAIGGLIQNPVSITSDEQGNLFVSNQASGTQSIVRLASGTFSQSLVSEDVSDPFGLEISPTGELIVVNNGFREVLGFSDSGSRIISGGDGSFIEPIGVDVDASGFIYVANQQDSHNFGNLLGIDPTSGDVTVLAAGELVSGAFGISLDSDGNLFVTNQTTNQLIRVDKNTLEQSVVASNFSGILGGVEIVGLPGDGPLGQSIPEPSGFALWLLGMPTLLLFRNRRESCQIS